MGFFTKVGLIVDVNRLENLGFQRDLVCDNGMFDTDLLGMLESFCAAHPKYHIVTLVDADDALAYYNCVACVNRAGYYLGDGDTDAMLWEDTDGYLYEDDEDE